MYGGYCFVLATSLLFLLLARLPPAHTEERCTYDGRHHDLNQTQSREIICSSQHIFGSNESNTIKHNVSNMENQNSLSIVYCEAPSKRYEHLNLYEEARHDGTKSVISSGACMISNHDANCTRVILYVNLTFYDQLQHNGSVIPVCALIMNVYNLDCFCIRYYMLGNAPDNQQDSKDCKPTTTEVTTKNATTTKPQPGVSHQTEAGVGSPAGAYSAATFQGAISVMAVVISIQAVAIGILILAIVCICKKKSIRRSSAGSVGYTSGKPIGDIVDVSPVHCRTQADQGQAHNLSDDEHEIDPFSDESRSKLLERSQSLPARSPTDTVGVNYKFQYHEN